MQSLEKGGYPASQPIPQTYFTVNQLVEVEPALGKGAVRNDLFHRRNNGLEDSGAVIYRGRHILLHRGRYLAWLEQRSRKVRA